ncbi:unnamed protein product [Didymodactylos carnosus]|uniref:Uncharacterized protein n=1 Tax=Didymodactylos carnosus TaxID=1234261 RepID=A0A8S2IF86_9BILA|nr:unnamed protein product [Didymodactylos carnosus]CAF3726797.1 unnamed protein product [Didymodactylos carnosus]
MAAMEGFTLEDFGTFDDILVGFTGCDEMEEFNSFWLQNMSTLFDDDDADDVIFVEELFKIAFSVLLPPGDEVIFIEEHYGDWSGFNEDVTTSERVIPCRRIKCAETDEQIELQMFHEVLRIMGCTDAIYLLDYNNW